MTINTDTNIYASESYGKTYSRNHNTYFEILESPSGKLQIPVITRKLNNHKSSTSPYGYPGVIIKGVRDLTELRYEWDALINRLIAKKYVHLKVKFPPFDREQVLKMQGLSEFKIFTVSETILVHLKNDDFNWKTMEGRSRTSVRKAQKAGLFTEISDFSNEDAKEDSEFRILYSQTMQRMQASSFYFFDDEYFSKLSSFFGQKIQKILVRDSAFVPVAAAIVMLDGSIAHYHLSGSTREGAKSGANNLMLWEMIRFCISVGCESLHLGGGISGRDSLFRFKESFGGEILPFDIGISILLPAVYHDLCALRSKELDIPLENILNSGYFPAYEFTSK